jgi:hypothetical protein
MGRASTSDLTPGCYPASEPHHYLKSLCFRQSRLSPSCCSWSRTDLKQCVPRDASLLLTRINQCCSGSATRLLPLLPLCYCFSDDGSSPTQFRSRRAVMTGRSIDGRTPDEGSNVSGSVNRSACCPPSRAAGTGRAWPDWTRLRLQQRLGFYRRRWAELHLQGRRGLPGYGAVRGLQGADQVQRRYLHLRLAQAGKRSASQVAAAEEIAPTGTEETTNVCQ